MKSFGSNTHFSNRIVRFLPPHTNLYNQNQPRIKTKTARAPPPKKKWEKGGEKVQMK